MTGARASARRLVASRVAVLVLATVSSYFVLHTLSVVWGPSGGFGIGIDRATAVVDDLAPRDASKGIRVGDRVDLGAMSFRDRDYLYQGSSLPIGLRMTVYATRNGVERSATFETIEYKHGFDDAVAMFGRKIVAMAYILVAVVLVWSRPNLMLWGLAVFLIRLHPWFIDHTGSPVLAALAIMSWAIIYSLGPAGLIVFAARFPDDRTNRATKYWDLIACAFLLYGLYEETYYYVPLFTTRPVAELPDWATEVFTAAAYLLVFITLCVKLVRAKSRSSLRSFRWVVAGYGVGVLLGWMIVGWILDYVPIASYWPIFGMQLLMLAFPASVFYAVVRYRAFGLGYLANRALVYGVFALGVISTVVIGVWVASGRLTSTIGIGAAMFVALFAGMAFQASRISVVRFVDRMFLRRRHEASMSLDRIREALRGSGDAKRLTDEVAGTLGLTSLAVFSRVPDGGFVRDAAIGWPPGAVWHLLPDEALTRVLDDGAMIVPVPDEADDEPTLPSADARPRFALTLRRGDRVERAILVGPQNGGATLDRDAMRTLHGVFDEAVFA